jgi:4-hydroxy-tetrahydrodipicolinate synthase
LTNKESLVKLIFQSRLKVIQAIGTAAYDFPFRTLLTMKNNTLIAAIGTPLKQDETLHEDGLEAHLADQWNGGMTGVLVGGTMGAMQMLTDSTYRRLVDCAIEFSRGKGEVMVGAGDTSLARTREKVLFLNERKIDATVVLSPFFLHFNQPELISYFTALANISKHPLFLYDLPGITKTHLTLDTVQQLARNPRIKGIKCSGDLSNTRQLIDSVPAQFRVVVAQADLVDVLMHHGIREHLDGVFSLAPFWVKAIDTAAKKDDWDTAARYQQRLSALLRVLKHHGVFQVYTLVLNERGIPGSYMPAPIRSLSDGERAAILREPVIVELLAASKDIATDNAQKHAADLQPAK